MTTTQDSLTGNGSLSLGQVAVTTWRGVVIPARSARIRNSEEPPAPSDMGAFTSTEARETMTNEKRKSSTSWKPRTKTVTRWNTASSHRPDPRVRLVTSVAGRGGCQTREEDMRMTKITTANDVRAWIQNYRGDLQAEGVEVEDDAVEAICAADHPAWGTDWDAWLDEHSNSLIEGVLDSRDSATRMTMSDRIQELRTEAAQAGDTEQVALCDRALDGDDEAYDECVRVLEDAAAQAGADDCPDASLIAPYASEEEAREWGEPVDES